MNSSKDSKQSLHDVVARAIAAEQLDWYANDRKPSDDGDLPDELAAAAIGVVLAEATRSIERVQADCDWRGRDALDMALVALKRLGEADAG